MSSDVFSEILNGLYENQVVPYLGPEALFDATNKLTELPCRLIAIA